MSNSEGFQFKPFSNKQKQVLSWWTDESPHKDKHMIVAYGAIRSGKTISMILSFVFWSLKSFPESQNFILAGRSASALKRNVLMPMIEMLNTLGIDYEYKVGEGLLLIGMHRYYLFGGVNERSFEPLQGLTAAGAYLDEVVLMPRSFVEQAFGRCSVNGAKYFMNLNPGSPLHWFKTDIIDKAKEKNALVIRFTMDDNNSLADKAKNRLRNMYSGVFKKRYIDGEFVLAEGLVYDAFDVESMTVSSIDEPIVETLIGADYGTQNSTVFLLLGIGRSKKVYVLDEYYHSGRESGRQKSPSEYSIDFQNFFQKHQKTYRSINRAYVDSAATHFIAQLYKDKVRGVVKAKKNVVEGIASVQNLIAQNRLHIHKSCKNTIKEMQSYSWIDGQEDAVLKQNDGCVDALRYAIYTANIT
ncbi:PBSX family phage terminase large subunit [Alkalihalobacterium chitinilyticum]|uniref:PBSX family phage terminase large subunit n=1 Tax=Alkalihalobacterium chitinilyticum TaxID=2980103 RepID=A0ABT5VJ58_9BACI|nr:PBSX family phage terminase large subunit [Alkalihalobacterium chitinilyticum]MDE5415493.1 PBSX family phage terminase large subunit [Alkalihalobacterium chitinilyticum]